METVQTVNGKSFCESCGHPLLPMRRLDLFWQGQRVPLTKTEIGIINRLMEGPATHQELFETYRSRGYAIGDGGREYGKSVAGFIKRIRRKFEAIDPAFSSVVNMAGVGYRWQTEEREADQRRDLQADTQEEYEEEEAQARLDEENEPSDDPGGPITIDHYSGSGASR